MLAEVAERGSLQFGVLEHGGSGERDEHLASVRRGHDARGAVHPEPVVPLLGHGGFGCVDAHSHAKSVSGRPFVRSQTMLAVDRFGGRLVGAREREEKRVALPVDLLAAVLANRLAQDFPVVCEDLSVSLPETLQQLGRTLDVREQEGDRSGQQICHSRVGQEVTSLSSCGSAPTVSPLRSGSGGFAAEICARRPRQHALQRVLQAE